MTIHSTSERTSGQPARDPAGAPGGGAGVVVGYEGTWRSTPAVQRAAAEAAGRGVPLTLLTVVPTGDDPDLGDRAQQADTAVRWELADTDGGRALDGVRSSHPGLSASLVVLAGSDAAQLERELGAAQLLVVGTSGREGPRAFLVGSTSRELVRAARCPVLVVPDDRSAPVPRAAVTGAPDDPTLRGSVVVGLRHGPESVGLLRVAAAEALRRGARLCVVHAYPASGAAGTREQVTDGVAGLLAQAGLDAALPVTTVLTTDPAAESLLGLGARADLLVVGSRGALAMARLALGSVSREVLDGADTAVLVVPHAVAEAVA